jgi:hypothetical protein
MAEAALVTPRLLALAVGFLVFASGCSEQSAVPTPASPSPRPSSTARIAIVEPEAGAVVPAAQLRVKVSLEGARILPTATTQLKADEGHLHLTLDGELQSMSYGLEHDVTVSPGDHILQAEFVAGDHAPFFPRVIAVKSFRAQ